MQMPASTTTEKMRTPVESEPALARAAAGVSQARDGIRTLLSGEAGKAWTTREIQRRARAWRGSIVHLALLGMCRSGEIEIGNDLAIRAVTFPARPRLATQPKALSNA